MFSEKWKKEIVTLPNLLSFFRIVLIPVYLTVYRNAASHGQYLLAGSILSVSCMTDMIDGMIARKCHMITNVGKVLDPLADKLTQLALILSLSGRYSALIPVLILFLVKECFQCGALFFFAQKGKVLPGALPAGKICTTVLFLSFIVLVLFPQLPSSAVTLLAATDLCFLLVSFSHYLMAYWGGDGFLTDLNRDT